MDGWGVSPFGPAVQVDPEAGGRIPAVAAGPSSCLDDAFGRAARGRRIAAMGQRQIGVRAHLDQAGRGALELLRLEAFDPAIEVGGPGCGPREELSRLVG